MPPATHRMRSTPPPAVETVTSNGGRTDLLASNIGGLDHPGEPLSIQRVRTIFPGVAGSPWYSNLYFTGETQTLADAATAATRAFWDSVKGYISTGISIQVQP